jgi:hypothetical protein
VAATHDDHVIRLGVGPHISAGTPAGGLG